MDERMAKIEDALRGQEESLGLATLASPSEQKDRPRVL